MPLPPWPVNGADDNTDEPPRAAAPMNGEDRDAAAAEMPEFLRISL